MAQRSQADLEAELQARRAQVDACTGHAWELLLLDPQEYPLVGDWAINATLQCAVCPATLYDLWEAADESLLHVELDNGIIVEAGRHTSPVALVVPVDVRIESWHSSTPNGEDWDAEIIVEQRGPVREENRV